MFPIMYRLFFKRFFDFILSLIALIVLSPVILIVAILVRIKLGSPIIFCQERPGKNEKIFKMYKFRTMTDEKDAYGNLLPDEARLTEFGKTLRNTSIDELPEAFNILKGEMSFIGPRPLLVRDMVFMTDKQRQRHNVRPGLSGLAQVNGRNAIDWERKLDYDLEYIKDITFLGDMKIILQTLSKAIIKQEGITEEGMATAEDYGDYLLNKGKIGKDKYESKQIEAKILILNNVVLRNTP